MPTLTGVSPNQGIQGTTVAVTLTGTNFVVGATTVAVGGGGVTVTNVVVGSGTSLTAGFVLDPTAAAGARPVTVTTGGGTSGAQTFTINLPPAPTLTNVSPNEGVLGSTVAVTLIGTNFVVGATTVGVFGGGVTVTNVVVGSSTSLTANLVLDPAATAGPRTVTVTTAGGTSGAQTVHDQSAAFRFPGRLPIRAVRRPLGYRPASAASRFRLQARQGGHGPRPGGDGGLGGQITATVSVTPGALLTVRVGGSGGTGVNDVLTAGAFNGGGGSAGDGGGGGGASSVHDGATPLVIAAAAAGAAAMASSAEVGGGGGGIMVGGIGSARSRRGGGGGGRRSAGAPAAPRAAPVAHAAPRARRGRVEPVAGGHNPEQLWWRRRGRRLLRGRRRGRAGAAVIDGQAAAGGGGGGSSFIAPGATGVACGRRPRRGVGDDFVVVR